MSDRVYVTFLLFGCAVVLIGLVWVVGEFTAPPREAHRPAVAQVSSREFAELSRQISHLAEQVAGQVRSGTGGGGPRTPLPQTAGEIAVLWSNRDLSVADPNASEWLDAPATTVPLQVQDQTMPVLEELTVSEIRVRALTDGRQIAWHLSWEDPTANYHLDPDRFCDAVAIQLPLEPNAAYTMGAVDFPVQISQWKAIWQKDIDEHFQDVQDLHPNYWADLYWFAEGEFPFRVPDAFERTESLDWFVAYRADNPMAELYRRQPVQELIAEGFGTLTNQPESATVARGVWADGRWSVVFARPMQTNDESDYQFKPGTRDAVAFAVWEGASGNVGGRKHHSQWIVFEVQQ
ncbi:MAG: ethylbenzene dehydrogenase-related protein [Planctomycetota bacterium]|jgi:hypothetical protein